MNTRFHARGPQPPAPEIVIVAVDERSIDAFFPHEIEAEPELALLQKWPFPRQAYAMVMDRLFTAGARLVVFDLIFPTGSVGDEEMKAAIARYADRVVVGSNFSEDGNNLMSSQAVIPETVPVGKVEGFTNYWPDRDGFVRHARLRTYWWMVAQIAPDPNEAPKLSLDLLAAKKFSPHRDWSLVAEWMPINFAGPPETYPTYPFYQILADQLWKENLRNGEVFRDKIVLIGPGGNFQHDTKLTPFADGRVREMPGVEIHANSIATLLHRSAPREVGAQTEGALIVGVGLLTALLLATGWHPLVKLGLVIAVGIGYFWGAALWFAREALLIPVAAPLWTVSGVGVLGIAMQVVLERLQQRRVRQTLEKFVSKTVADEILKHQDEYQQTLGGVRRSVTILFSDIRGFTTLSETLNPLELVSQLNEYLTAMVAIVMANNGTLDKFIGDAIMAVYGAPTSAGATEDAWRAVKTAYEMRLKMVELTKQWEQKGLPPLRIGVGLNHGEVVVGYIGSPQRLEYTVIGDPVNVASRVEGLNKEFKTDLLLTDTVYELVKDRVEVRQLGEIAVKGRAQKVGVYALEGLRDNDAAAKSAIASAQREE